MKRYRASFEYQLIGAEQFVVPRLVDHEGNSIGARVDVVLAEEVETLLRRAVEAIENLADLVPLDDEEGTNKWTVASADLVRQDIRNALRGQDDCP